MEHMRHSALHGLRVWAALPPRILAAQIGVAPHERHCVFDAGQRSFSHWHRGVSQRLREGRFVWPCDVLWLDWCDVLCDL